MTQNNVYMAWNEPGGKDGRKDPWSPKNPEQGPPDLDQILKKLQEKLKSFWGDSKKPRLKNQPTNPFSGNGGFEAKLLSYVLLIIVVLGLIISGIYIVDPPERAVITRFGRYVRTEGPGPHWIFPIIDSKKIVNVEQVETSVHSGLMLTRDGNIVSIGVAVEYKIGEANDDVRAYLFNVVNPIQSLNLSAESAVRQVVGQSTMDEVLTLKRAEIAQAIKEQIIETMKTYNTGIQVSQVSLQFAKAPDEVRAAFDDVIKAAADEERLVNQARAYENEVLPRARGTAERLRNEALGYKQEVILRAEGNVQRFNLVLPEYLKSPKVMQTRMYLDTMEKILSKTSKVLVDAGIGNNLIYLPLDKIMTEKTEGESTPSTESLHSNNPKDILSTSPGLMKEKNQ